MEPIIIKMLEYAPAVAILLYLNWRMDRVMGRILDLCINAWQARMADDENDQGDGA